MKVKLKEIGKIITGNTPSKQNTLYYNSNDILFIKPDILQLKKVCDISDSKEFISENARAVSRIVPKGSLLVTCIGIIGKIGIVDIDECAFNQQINAIIPNYNIKSKYLAYVLFYNRGRLNDIANAPVVPIINKSEFENFEVNIIDDIKKQENIIQILDKFENIIYKYECILKALDTLIKARFVEMFGDSPNNKYYSIKLGEVSLSKGEYGANSASIAFTDNRARYIRITDINDDGTLNNDKVASINVSDDVKYKLEYGDIIFARTGATVGKSYCYQTNENQIFAGYLIKFKINVDKMVPVFIFYNTKMKYYDEWVKNSQGGAAQPNINEKKYSSFELINAPIDLQQQFATFVKEVDKLKFDVQKSLEKTQMLFDSLMQQYFG